jgi:hypothetical protein
MDQTLFEAKFSSIMKKLDNAQSDYEFKTGDIWDKVGLNPLDLAFTELSELYLEADSTQRKCVFEEAARAELPYNLWYFIRRVAKHIQSPGDAKWLEIGLAASLIDGGRGDFRDLTTSLVLLRFAAEIHAIDTKPFFDNAIQNSDEVLKPILLNARNHSEADVHYSVQAFGWPELVDESKKRFGEHPSAAELIRRRETGAPWQINCSTLLIILLIILGIAVFLLIRWML